MLNSKLSRKATVFLICAGVLGLPAAGAFAQGSQPAKPKPRQPVSTNAGLLANGSFDNGLSGWGTYNAGLSLVSPGSDGSPAARVTAGSADSSYSIAPDSVPVAAATVAGQVFTAGAQVRGGAAGVDLCLRVREWSGSSVVGGAKSCVPSSPEWKAFPAVAYGALENGNRLDMYVYQLPSQAGDHFDVDAVTFSASAAPSPPPPPPPEPEPPPPTNRLYAPDAPINTPIPAGASVDPNSPAMVSRIVTEVQSRGWPIAVKLFGNTIYYVDSTTPKYNITLSAGGYNGKVLQGVPIPNNAVVEPSSDGGLVTIDRSTGCEYDLARAVHSGSTWSAYFANTIVLEGNGIYPFAESPSASGFASAAGTITPEDLAAGRIDHGLRFAMNTTKAGGPVSPATGSDGWSSVAGAIPEGAHIQLNPSLNLDSLGLTPWQKTVARALQEYGMWLVDTGGAPSLYAQNPLSTSIAYPWGDVDYAYMPNSLASQLRVLTLPPQFSTIYRFVPNRCATLG